MSIISRVILNDFLENHHTHTQKTSHKPPRPRRRMKTAKNEKFIATKMQFCVQPKRRFAIFKFLTFHPTHQRNLLFYLFDHRLLSSINSIFMITFQTLSFFFLSLSHSFRSYCVGIIQLQIKFVSAALRQPPNRRQ